MEKNSTGTPEASLFDGTAWFDPIEAGVRERIRGFIETMLEEELKTALGRERYRRGGEAARRRVDIAMVFASGDWLGHSARSRSRCRGGDCRIPRVAPRNGVVPPCRATPA